MKPTTQVLVRMQPEQCEQLDALKEMLHCSRNAVILQALDYYLESNGPAVMAARLEAAAKVAAAIQAERAHQGNLEVQRMNLREAYVSEAEINRIISEQEAKREAKRAMPSMPQA